MHLPSSTKYTARPHCPWQHVATLPPPAPPPGPPWMPALPNLVLNSLTPSYSKNGIVIVIVIVIVIIIIIIIIIPAPHFLSQAAGRSFSSCPSREALRKLQWFSVSTSSHSRVFRVQTSAACTDWTWLDGTLQITQQPYRNHMKLLGLEIFLGFFLVIRVLVWMVPVVLGSGHQQTHVYHLISNATLGPWYRRMKKNLQDYASKLLWRNLPSSRFQPNRSTRP